MTIRSRLKSALKFVSDDLKKDIETIGNIADMVEGKGGETKPIDLKAIMIDVLKSFYVFFHLYLVVVLLFFGGYYIGSNIYVDNCNEYIEENYQSMIPLFVGPNETVGINQTGFVEKINDIFK